METLKDKWARLIFIPLLGLMSPLLFKTFEGSVWTEIFLRNILISTFCTLILWQGNRYIVGFLRNYYPGYQNTIKRVIYQTLLSSVYTVVAISIIFYFVVNFTDGQLCSKEGLWVNVKIGLVCTFFISAIYESVYFFSKWKETIIEAEELKRSNIQSQYETLKNQVNPHFLFNSFNTLSSIIDEDPKTAVQFVQQLSNVYRYVLHSKDRDLVTVETEITFIRSYLFLQQIRFGNNLKINIDVPAVALQKQLPPLVLQLLVENAIKHNIVSSEKPLFIDIFLEGENNLVVKNNLQKKSSVELSSGMGLQNIINRYSVLSEEKVAITESEFSFEVLFPIFS